MEDPEKQDPETHDEVAAIIPAALPLKEYAIQAKALERARVPKTYAEMISRVGGTGGIQKFILSEANGLWNDPRISAQLWHGIRLWFAIKLALFGIAVVRVLPALLLWVVLIGGGTLGLLAVGFVASSNTAKNTAAMAPYRGATIDLSEVSDVQAGTKLKYTAYTAPVMGEVTAKDIDFVIIKWQFDDKVIRYSYEQFAQDLKSGRIVINRD
jgi:hypothetical protein